MEIDTRALAKLAESTDFTGVVAVHQRGEILHGLARGLADRAHRVPVTLETRFGTASGSKAMTALVALALSAQGSVTLNEGVRRWLGDDLSGVDDDVTLEQLLTHTSGISDYLDEEEWEPDQYMLSTPVHKLDSATAFLPELAATTMRDTPGETYRYNNGAFVIAALVLERATSRSYHELVHDVVLAPAGMMASGFYRMDSLPGDVARGYISAHGFQSNVLHLPVLATGDGGMFTTVDDVHRFWTSLTSGRIVSGELVDALTAPRHFDEEEHMRSAMGVWRHPTSPAWILDGMDAGVSFHSAHDPERDLTGTVMSSTADGAWAIAEWLRESLG